MSIKSKGVTRVRGATTIESERGKVVSKIIFTCLLITASILLFVALSSHSVLAKGEFAYLESIGFLLAFLVLFSFSFYSLIKKFPTLRFGNRLLRFVVYVGVIGGSTLSLLFIITALWFRIEVATNCLAAKKEYDGECVDALARQLHDVNRGFWPRNNAIWTLGQLASKSSLPSLYAYYTGEITERESLTETISQYELKKAITWCEKGNITSWLYKGL